MKRIIRTELLKLPSRGNYILLAILLLIYLGMSYGLYAALSSEQEVSFFDLGKQLLEAQFSLAGILVSIFLISNIGKEFKDGTLRKNIIDGYSRNDFYVGKIVLLLGSVAMAYLLAIFCLFLVSALSGQVDDFTTNLNLQFVLNYILKLSYSALWASFLIFLFRKLTISLVLYFVWSIIEAVIFQVQQGMREDLNLPADFNIQDYLPRSSLSQTLNVGTIVDPSHLIVTSIYVILFLFLPYYLFTKADIKS
ncbi:MAG: ABC transporter permease [Vicingaceae bacterium]